MKLGPPDRCMGLQQGGGEVCTWRSPVLKGRQGQYSGAQYGLAASGDSHVSSWEHQVTFYDLKSIIIGWSYPGSLGKRDHEDAKREQQAYQQEQQRRQTVATDCQTAETCQ
jgi:hypothetical protein